MQTDANYLTWICHVVQKKAEHNAGWQALLPGTDPSDSLEEKHCHITRLSVRGDTRYQWEAHLPHAMKGLPSAFVDMTCFCWHYFVVSLAETMPLGDDIPTSELSVEWQNHPWKHLAFRQRSLRSLGPFPLHIWASRLKRPMDWISWAWEPMSPLLGSAQHSFRVSIHSRDLYKSLEQLP